jgi:selenophosphate synthase
MAAGSGFGTRVHWNAVPVLDAVWEMVRQDCIPDGTQNNLDYLTGFVEWGARMCPRRRKSCCVMRRHPGGLLMAVPPDKVAALQAALAQTPSPGEVIGEIIPAPGGQI